MVRLKEEEEKENEIEIENELINTGGVEEGSLLTE